MTYEIKEVQVRKDDPLYPRTVYRILKKGKRLVENPLRNEDNPKHYIWEEYEQFLLSDYLSYRAAEKMIEFKLKI